MILPVVTYEEFLTLRPCWAESAKGRRRLQHYSRKLGGQADALDILRLKRISATDRLWAVLREEFVPANLLHEFACRVAERALALVDNPDPRSVEAIEAKRKWLRGEITDAELHAACDAARNAARAACDAAQDAAWAAQDAAWAAWAAACAAWAAAWATARDAAWATAWAAARDAALTAALDAETATWDAQVDMLIDLLTEAGYGQKESRPLCSNTADGKAKITHPDYTGC